MNWGIRFLKISILPGILVFAGIVLSAGYTFSQKKNITPPPVEAGFASIDITPEFPVRMAGYAARLSSEADSILQPISAKALALGSDTQNPSLLITVDLVGIPWRITRDVADYLSKEKGIKPEQIAIYASHTHGGPEVGNLINILQYRKERFTDSLLELNQLIHITQYTEQLTRKLKEVAVEALSNRKPAHIYWGQGQALFANNRRTKGGPVDVALPILKITNPDGTLRGVFINYACHGTTLGGNMHKIHGDWIAEAHREIETRHPGTTALIALGCAGDANPSPRGTVENIQQHGKEIADNVDKLLTAQLQPLHTPPAGKMKWVKLPFSKIPDAAELITWTNDGSIKGFYARLALESTLRGDAIPPALDYPVQVWNFDNKMAMINLAGEVVVDYSIRLKDAYGAEQLWVNGYANDVSCYIASRRIVKEGGYEGETSMYWYNKPSAFIPEVEDIIIHTADELIAPVFKNIRPETNHQTVIQKEDDGSYRLSSWLAGTKGERIKYMPEWKAFGWFDAKDQASWEVEITKPGRYDVFLEWSVSDAMAGKSFEITAGNKKVKGRVEKTGSWFTYHTQKMGSLLLKQGRETFILKSAVNTIEGSMFDVREIRLVPAK